LSRFVSFRPVAQKLTTIAAAASGDHRGLIHVCAYFDLFQLNDGADQIAKGFLLILVDVAAGGT
jgi:hypothetical protein